MTVNTAAGSRVYIGSVGPAANLAAYQADTYVEIGEVSDLGEFGDQVGVTNFTALKDRRVRKFKTTYDAGDLTITVGDDPSDAGQDAVIAALADDFEYNIKVELSDELTDGGTPTTLYFSGPITSGRYNVGSVESIVQKTLMVGINTQIYSVDPT